MKYNKYLKYALYALTFTMCGVLYSCGSKSDVTEIEPVASECEATTIYDEEESYFVYVCGAVLHEGVYEVKPGSRVCDAIEKAGGLADRAVIDSMNLADKISDGDKIYVPDEITAATDVSQNDADSRININTADRSELMTLPGIGEAKAELIIKYREQNGSFNSIEDIMNISGIKESAFSKIKDLIKV